MTEVLFVAGDVAVTIGQALPAAGVVGAVMLIVLAVQLGRAARERRREAEAESARARLFDERMNVLARTQSETIGSLRAMSDSITGRQAELARLVGDSLTSVSHRLNQSLSSTTQQTMQR